jgi:predicted DNA-binding transcriptional regulator AlpA
MDPVSTMEIARMLGVSRQRVHQLRQTDGFPPAAVHLGIGDVWDRAAIEAWAAGRGRTLREGSTS